MPDPIITLTTDFGLDSPYVAAMKGVIISFNARARLIDLSHQIPPQDLRHAAFFLRHSVPWFPSTVLHVVVVDPGVGSERALLYVETGGHRLLVPDNGCWTLLADRVSTPPHVRRLAEPKFWQRSISPTFHGRDILAPVAGWLSRGVRPEELGPIVTEWVRLAPPAPACSDARGLVGGEVAFIDHFGNIITSIPGEAVFGGSGTLSLHVQGTADREAREFQAQRVRTYADAEPGTLVGLVSSVGLLEFAVVQGNGARRLGLSMGDRVTVRQAHES